MKAVLGLLALFIAIGGFINFFASLNALTPFPVGISHPLAMLAMAYLLFQFIFPAMIYRVTPAECIAAVQHLQATGALVAATTCGGSIGALSFRGPLLRVEVYPGGLLIKPLLMPAIGIFREEMTSIRTRDIWLRELVELIHTSKLVATPIRLECRSGNTARYALFQFVQTQVSSAEGSVA
jgi:hypothetical protein